MSAIQGHEFQPYLWDRVICGYVDGDNMMCGSIREDHARNTPDALLAAAREIRAAFERCNLDDPLYAGLQAADEILSAWVLTAESCGTADVRR